jgi:heparosan-N-sulfate-glucuronate 5-epimerase
MLISKRLQYYRRICRAYLLPGTSQLSFWHDSAEVNQNASTHSLDEYYMTFSDKARYTGPFDHDGIPMLNYHGTIGVQYNPIAIAQWGLGNYNLFRRTDEEKYRRNLVLAAEWLCANLAANEHGVPVWNHHFDWDYREILKAPWYSGLAQGQGISLLLRAHAETGDQRFLDSAGRAFQSFLTDIRSGGVTFTDASGSLWFEEYIVSKPTHILNGFIWAAWGVYDYFLATGSRDAVNLFASAVETLRENLGRYDLGFWSLYEQAGTRLPMIASPFYHRLHITQLRVMHRITSEAAFSHYADRWESYSRSPANRTRALCYKGAFKLCYY